MHIVYQRGYTTFVTTKVTSTGQNEQTDTYTDIYIT